MRKRFKFIMILFVTALVTAGLTATASAATLTWGASSGTVDGYRVHYGTNATTLANTVDVGNTTLYSLESLPLSENTQYFFSVSAYNEAGESNACAPVAYAPADTTPPAPPAGLAAE
jgi:Fibronectin type III domain